jgi:CHAP domain
MDDVLQDLFNDAKEDLGETSIGDRSPFVDTVNALAGVPMGSPWCASWVGYRVHKTATKWQRPILIQLSASVMTMKNLNILNLEDAPQTGFIMLMQHAMDSAGHCGIVGAVADDGSFESLEGNTSNGDPANRNGGAVAIHTRKVGQMYGHLHIVGFLRPF